MKKIAGLLGAALLAGSLIPSAIAAPPPTQTEEGAIALPAPFTDNSGCFAGLQRRVAILSMEQVNGVIGFNFDVDPKTWNKNFVLEPTGGAGDVDLDIYFYQEFGTVDDVAGDPVGAGAPVAVSFNTREPGGESGKVPVDFNKVIVCMYGGDGGAGAGATFLYEAGKGVKLPK